MKYFSKLAFFSLSLLLVGCGGGDKEDPKPLNQLVGIWTGVSQETKLMSGTKTYKQALLDEVIGADANWAAQMVQISTQAGDFAYTVYLPEIEIKDGGTWSSAGVTGKWTLSDDKNTLTMTIDTSTAKKMVGTITKLTDTDLWIEVKVRVTDSLGILPAYDYSSVLKYSRKK